MNKNNTKIIATKGPACADKKTLTNMIKNGVNVCRLNFSHADHKTQLDRIKLIKDISAGAVSFAVISSLIVLFIIYYPYVSASLK